MRNTYTDLELNYLRKNYPLHGAIFCSQILNRSPECIRYKCSQLKLKTTRNWRSENGLKNIKTDADINTYKVDPLQFINCSTPTCAYILGLLWADGYVQYPYLVSLSTTYPDAEYFIKLFNTTGMWKNYTKIWKNNSKWKPACTIKTSNKHLVQFLLNNDYLSKSSVSADKIISTIPSNLTHYWLRGLFDGDGHIYTNNGSHRISFSSSYNQDWSYLKNICKKLEIKFATHQEKREKSSGSSFVVYGKYRVNSFCQFMYNGFPEDLLGLNRKYENFLKLKERL